MSPLEFMQRFTAPVADTLSRSREKGANDCCAAANVGSRVPGSGRIRANKARLEAALTP